MKNYFSFSFKQNCSYTLYFGVEVETGAESISQLIHLSIVIVNI